MKDFNEVLDVLVDGQVKDEEVLGYTHIIN